MYFDYLELLITVILHRKNLFPPPQKAPFPNPSNLKNFSTEFKEYFLNVQIDWSLSRRKKYDVDASKNTQTSHYLNAL